MKVQHVKWLEKKKGYTPVKGRPSKSAALKTIQPDLRQKNCIGVVLVSRTDQRGKCRMCGERTQYYCTGCKNSFCFQTGTDCSKKIEQMIENNSIIECNEPSPFLMIRAKDGNKEVKVRNSCYYIAHAEQFGNYFNTKQNGKPANSRNSTGQLNDIV